SYYPTLAIYFVHPFSSTSRNSVRSACQFHAVPSLRANSGTRRKRQFTPDEQKDGNYWLKRTRNNEAAKRSRQRKRMEEHLLESRAVELQRENDKLKAVLSTVHHHSAAQSNPMHAAFGFPLGLPNGGHPRSLPVPTTVLPLRSLSHCPFSDCCGSVCPQTNHFSSVFDLVSYPMLKNAVATNTTKPPRINLLDSYHPMGRYSLGSACTRGAYQRNRSFANGNDSAQTMHGLPDYRNTLVNLSRVPRCYKASSSEMAQDCARQPGPIGAAHEGEMPANAAELTRQRQATTQPVLLPHKLRYKGGNARFASASFSS
uniref:Si:dkey-60d5.3 n=1 Tax=Cyprinus carpio carpio TaxID=630221 RepID=A0A8C0XXI0_CYPCA